MKILFGWKKLPNGSFCLIDKESKYSLVVIWETKGVLRNYPAVYLAWKYHSLSDPTFDTFEEAMAFALKEVKEQGYKILPPDYMILK